MIKLGVITSRQDIKTDEPLRKPAAKLLLLPVIAFYLVVGFFSVMIARELIPVSEIAYNRKNIEAETNQAEGHTAVMSAEITENDKIKAYVEKKEAWVKQAFEGGEIMRKIFAALPQDVKLREFSYQYEPPSKLLKNGQIRIEIFVRGTYEAGRISNAIREIDSRLVVQNSSQDITEQGIELKVEYQIK
ncbi:MAG: hypothetical protein V1746_01345 [bacterium]